MITKSFVDTHCHLDGEEFAEDLEQVIARAREAGVKAIGVPGIDLKSCDSVMALCERYPDFCFPMLGLHPEEVRIKAQSSKSSPSARSVSTFTGAVSLKRLSYRHLRNKCDGLWNYSYHL